jgi:hypothetical protein
MTSTVDQIITDITDDVEAFFDDAWADLKPLLVALGQTLLSQVATAAGSVASGSATYTQALASLVAQLPADALVAEKDVAAALAAAITALASDL